MPKGYLDSIEIDCKTVAKRKKSIIQELDDLDEVSSLPSSLLDKTKEKKKKKKEKKPIILEDGYDGSEWLEALVDFKVPKNKKRTKLFEDDSTGKKKKDKKKKDGAISHKKDFEPEMALLKNLQMEQSKFVDSLQKKYDQMEGTKSTARGIGKFTTDLIDSINTGRSISMQLIDKLIGAKKTVADLDFKERKEFGTGASGDQQNLSNYAANYLKQLVTTGRNTIMGGEGYEIDDVVDDDDILSSISSALEDAGGTNRSEETETYLKYENDNVSVKVIWFDDKECDDPLDKYEFAAYKANGEEIDDYPLPHKTPLSLNRSTKRCTDAYGNKYDLIIV